MLIHSFRKRFLMPTVCTDMRFKVGLDVRESEKSNFSFQPSAAEGQLTTLEVFDPGCAAVPGVPVLAQKSGPTPANHPTHHTNQSGWTF